MIWAQWRIGAAILASAESRTPPIRFALRLLVAAMTAWLAAGFAFNFHAVIRLLHVSPTLRGAVSGGAYVWAFSATGSYLFYWLWRLPARAADAAQFSPGRRKLVGAVGNALVAAPVMLAGYGGFVERTKFQVREVDILIPNLPPDLQGLRILQLSDIHLGPFLSERDLARVIDEALNLRPHIAVVTGDLISMRGDPLDACLRQIARLRPEAGIFGCLGNHEVYAEVETYTQQQAARLGIEFLRGAARPLRFGPSTLNLAGVDYQSIAKPESYLIGAQRLIAPGAVNVLLSHNPDVFPVAAGQGFDLTLGGHTHGGQVNVEILSRDLNIARFFTPYVYGRYTLDRASIYVSRGIGTIGLPIRIGAPPEITLLRLIAGPTSG